MNTNEPILKRSCLDLETVERWRMRMPRNTKKCYARRMKKSGGASAWRRNGWKENMIEEPEITSAAEKLNWGKQIFQENWGKPHKVTVSAFSLSNKSNKTMGFIVGEKIGCHKMGLHGLKMTGCIYRRKSVARREGHWKPLSMVTGVLLSAQKVPKPNQAPGGVQDQLLCLYYFTCSLNICYWAL